MTKRVNTVTFVDGVTVDSVSTDDLVRKIESTEAEIGRLKQLTTKSAGIDKMVKSLEGDIDQLVKVLDEKAKK